AVQETYQCELSEAEIIAYYELKERLRQQKAPDAPVESTEPEEQDAWVRQALTLEERRVLQQALMRRLVSCLDRLDQVQRDKPGNYRLWRGKLVSERYWASLLEAEQIVSDEISSCVSEAAILEPGWNYWRRLELLRFQGRAPERRVVSACPRASNTVKSRRLFQLSGLHPTFKDPSSATRDEGRFRASLVQADTSGCPTSFLLPPPPQPMCRVQHPGGCLAFLESKSWLACCWPPCSANHALHRGLF
ncbi:unnamed protein product, partial [Symbiodinium necroappetens]